MEAKMHLQPAQYESWLRKSSDPDWAEHRYRSDKDRAMVAAILDLRDARAENASLRAQVERLSAPVSEEEYRHSIRADSGIPVRMEIDYLIAARLAPQSGPAGDGQ